MSEFKLTSWEEWFENCNWLRPRLEEYENLMRKYFSMQCSKTQQGRQRAEDCFLRCHDVGFYRKNTKVPRWYMKRCMLFGLLGLVVGGVLAGGFSVYSMLTSGTTDMKKMLIVTAAVAVLCGMAACVIPVMVHTWKIDSVCKKLGKLEEELRDRVAPVPPKYRNSQACNTLYDAFASYDIVNFQAAISVCDDYLVSNRMSGAYMAVLYDVPYVNKELAGSVRSGSKHVEDIPDSAFDDPDLPSDIKDKTFTGVDNADSRLNELVGLEKVKEQVRQMKNRISFYKGSQESVSGNHMAFLGPPGTGKTTIARIITKLLYDYGYIRDNKCVEVDGGYLKSPIIGQTAPRVNAIVRYAMGGVLFIDEAYILTDDKGGTSGSAGSEATGVLLKAMEDHRNDLVVIMAGYEDNMNRLFASNEGFSSRIKYKIYFDNFTVDELVKIFKQQMKSASVREGVAYKIEKSAMEMVRKQLEREVKTPGFGNARVVRNMWDGIMDVHADRFVTKHLSEDRRYIISKEDAKQYIEKRQKQMQEDGRNFIASRNLDSSVISLAELQGKTKKGSENPDADLAKLTGLNVVKDEIRHMKAQFEFYNGEMESEGYHMTFIGPPGTGKTTVASIITGYLYQMDIIAENRYLDINGDFLRGMYVGHTGKRTEAVVQYAQGMVLFVDEAYLLAGQPGDNNSFGQEAVGVLLDAMEKYRKNFVVIFAGYEKEMNAFLDMNSGLRSRISLSFHFQSYTPNELAHMMQKLAKEQKFKVDQDVWKPLQRWLAVQVKDPHFGNGRFIRQFWESCKKVHIMNYADGLYDQEGKFVIYLKDVQDVMTARDNGTGTL